MKIIHLQSRFLLGLILIGLLTLQSFSDDEKSNKVPTTSRNFVKIDEIVIRNTDKPNIDQWHNYCRTTTLMIADKVYCPAEFNHWYRNLNDEYKPEKFKLWLYDIKQDKWSVELETKEIDARQNISMFNCDGNLLIYGGWLDLHGYAGFKLFKCFNDGSVYNTKDRTIKKLPTENAPSPRAYYSAVFSGEELIVFGGVNKNHEILNDGAIFNVKTWKWRKISSEGLFGSLAFQKAIWLQENSHWKYSNCMLVWGGTDTIKAVSSLQLLHKDKSGKDVIDNPKIDDYKIIPKGLVAIYQPDKNKWLVIEMMNYEESRGGGMSQYSLGRTGSALAQSGDFVIEWGGVDEEDKWKYQGRKLDLKTFEFCSMTKENQPPARIEHELIPFQEADKTGKICNKVLVAFGDQHVKGGCATGWRSYTCGVYNVDIDSWEKKMFCPFTNFESAKYEYCAWDKDKIFHSGTQTVVYNIKDDIADCRFGNGFKSDMSRYFDLKYVAKREYLEKSRQVTDYYFTDFNRAGYLDYQGRCQLYKLTIPDDYDAKKEKLEFQRVGTVKQSLDHVRIYDSKKYAVGFDINSIYYTDETELPRCKSCGFVLNKETGEIYDIPVYENSLARQSASIVLSDDKLYIIGGMHENPMYYNEYSWDNSDARVENLPAKGYIDISYTECKMPMKTRKRLYPDYPFLNDMYIFDLNNKSWSQQYFPKNIKSRKFAGVFADDDIIYIIGGKREKVHDNMPEIPKSLFPWEDKDYFVKNGFCYDTKRNEYFNIDEIIAEYGDKYIEPGTTYKVFNSNIIAINTDVGFDQNKNNHLLQRYNFETRKWEKKYLPENKWKEGQHVRKAVNCDNGLYLLISDDDETYEIYKLTDDFNIVEVEQFRKELENIRFYLELRDKNYSYMNIHVKDSFVVCNFILGAETTDENKCNTKGIVFDLQTGKATKVNGFPVFDDDNDIYDHVYNPFLDINTVMQIQDRFEAKDYKKYGDNVSIILSIYNASK